MKSIEQFHLAAQYLAMAGKSFLEPKDDDSHTNVGFFSEDHTIRTWPLDDFRTYLAFDFDEFSLTWNSTNQKTNYPLDGKNHKEILKWISKMAKASNFEKSYDYNLHYKLPYKLSANFKFESPSHQELNDLLQLRILAQNVLEEFLKDEELKSDIRIWPHHLDTGAFTNLNDGSKKSVGLGLAIPDSVSDSHYFYISGYKGSDGIATANFSALTHGEWKNNGFKGAVLKANTTENKQAIQFFKEAYKIIKNSI